MLKNLKKRQEGFTIIEVMIVLVIAAVILLIVFLAVPALQRNSRNTQVKNEAGQTLAAASEWSSNANGKVPSASSSTTANSDAAGILSLTKNKNLTTFTVSAYSAGKTFSTTGFSPSAVQGNAYLVTGASCGSGAGTATANVAKGSTRQVALFYVTESPSLVVSCQDSGL